MELCENSNINNFIQKLKQSNVPLSEDVCFILFLFYFAIVDEKRIWLILSQCLLGLAILKCFNIIHRNIKKENIFIMANNKVKIGFLCLFLILFCIFFKGEFGVSRELSFHSEQSFTHIGT
jgi:serine/threonine protein kinase